MRKNIFELMRGNKIDLFEEYYRLYRLFQKTRFEDESSIMSFIQNYYFLQWEHRKRYISIRDLLTSLELTDDEMDREDITNEKLLLYCEIIYNLINLMENNTLSNIGLQNIKVLENNVLDLLEDMNYEIKRNTKKQFVIIEKDNLSTAIAEKFPDIADKVIEYRRFILKGNIKAKKEILLELSNKIEPLRNKFKNTSYKDIIEDINMLLNNLNIRHNNIEGKHRKEHTAKMSNEELEKWYDKTYDMILGAFILEDYIDSKLDLDLLKSQF